MVFVHHQLLGFRNLLIIKLCGFFQGQVGLLHHAFIKLDKRHYGIIYNPNKLAGFVLFNFSLRILLQTTDALCLYKNLVGKGRKPENTPRTSVIVHFLDKQLPAFFNLVVVLI